MATVDTLSEVLELADGVGRHRTPKGDTTWHDDIRQAARVEAWKAWTVEGSMTRTRAGGIARRGAIQEYRSRYHHRSPVRMDSYHIFDQPDTVFADLRDHSHEAWADSMDVRAAVAALPNPLHREYVWLRWWMGYTSAAAAVMLGKRPDTMVQAWVQTIRPKLRKAVGER